MKTRSVSLSLPFRLLLCLCTYLIPCSAGTPESHEYCVVGAGPSGLQMAHFLAEAGRDFILLERSNVSGSFYVKYPRHRTLISINKRFTGSSNREFNFRHDWNSLISHSKDILFTQYSKEYFPPADAYLKYLEDFRREHHIPVRYNTEVRNLRREGRDDCVWAMEDQRDNSICCQFLLMATGVGKAVVPSFAGGVEHSISYSNMSMDPADYEGKSVLIIGRGNSGLETAKGLYGAANFVHLVARSRVKFSWETHYVGDIRGVNNEVLDAYMLKSLDGVFEAGSEEMRIVKRDDGRLMLIADGFDSLNYEDSNPTRDAYDIVITCTGFQWDSNIFANHSRPSNAIINGLEHSKYPKMGPDFQSTELPGLYFLGTLTHALDWRKSAGGFIHGFRYNARVLHRLLEWKQHLRPWPAARKATDQLLPSLLKRANEASAIYQMFQFLSDVVILDRNEDKFLYLEEFPIQLIPELPAVGGHDVREGRHEVFVLTLEYGANFSKAGQDHFGDDRAHGDVGEAHLCNFLHPVIYFYRRLPSREDFQRKDKKETLPRPDAIHHVLEDFTTVFDGPTNHVLPLRRFLEFILGKDLRVWSGESCMRMALSGEMATLPPSCRRYLRQLPASFAFVA